MTNSEIALKYINLAIPCVAQNVMRTFIAVANLYFIGHLGNTSMTAGFGLAVSCTGILGWSILAAVNCAQETLTSQAFGAGQLRLCGVYLNRGRIVLIAVTIPLAIIFWFSESIFLMLKQDPEVARYAGKYVHVQMISLFFIGQFDLTKRFLMQVQVAWVPFFANIVCTALHLLWLYILIVRMNLEIVGAGIAMATTGFLLLSSVTAVSYFIPSIRPALFCPNADSFT